VEHAAARADINGMSRVLSLTGLLIALVISAPVTAARLGLTFERYTFTLDLPAGYALQANANPKPGFGTFGFATEPRSDTTRGMIQLSLLDFKQTPPGEKITLDRFAAAMIDAVRQRRTRWEQTESEVRVAGVTAKRIAWSGSMEPGFARPPINMSGVMIIGIAKDLGFALHTQDVMTFADTTVPLCEQSLLTFNVSPTR
jgi:hypothetical protein